MDLASRGDVVILTFTDPQGTTTVSVSEPVKGHEGVVVLTSRPKGSKP